MSNVYVTQTTKAAEVLPFWKKSTLNAAKVPVDTLNLKE
jgi:hypothetical protein